MPNENEEIQTTTSDSIYGVNDNGEASVRIASEVTGDPTSIYGVDENGNACVRVMGSGGGGGGDQHNLGWYATQSALEEAHPTAEAGDYAIVGSTDTVWVWDNDSAGWKDTGQAGIELPSQTGNGGKFLTTDGTNASWGTTIQDRLNISLNSANAEFIRFTNQNNVVMQLQQFSSGFAPQFAFYWKSSSSSQQRAVVFQGTSVFPNINDETLGKDTNKWDNVYTTKLNNGADITVPNATGEMVVNTATQSSSLSILGNAATGANSLTMLAKGAGIPTSNGVVILNSSFWSNPTSIGFISIGTSHGNDLPGNTSISIKGSAKGYNSIQLGSGTNSDANTFKVGNANGNYEIMSADGTIPTARLTKVNTTITLTAAGWSSNTQTVNVTGMTATGVVMVSPDPTDQSAYTSNGILCTAQAAGTLTFTCDTVPSGDIDVNVVML